jgi:hypothetical protein
MVKGETKSGFAYSLDPGAFTDAEFLEDFVAVRDGDELCFFQLIEKMLGKAQKKALYEHLRDENGKVPVSALTAEFTEMIEALAANAQTKN